MRYAIRFLILGAVLYGLLPLARDQGRGEGIPADEDALLARAATAIGFRRDDAVIERRLIRNARFLGATDDTAALRDAGALELDGSDLVVQRRLATRLRLAIEGGARTGEPSEDALRAYIAAHSDRFVVPARAQVTQIFFSRARRGASLDADARRARARLQSGASVTGDALPLPSVLPPLTESELAAMFGDAVARAAFTAPSGEWSAPVASPYGLHLLRVDARHPSRAPVLDEVRAAAREGVLAARGDAAVAAALRQLRAGG
jgi:PPIC-type PPIASE domain